MCGAGAHTEDHYTSPYARAMSSRIACSEGTGCTPGILTGHGRDSGCGEEQIKAVASPRNHLNLLNEIGDPQVKMAAVPRFEPTVPRSPERDLVFNDSNNDRRQAQLSVVAGPRFEVRQEKLMMSRG